MRQNKNYIIQDHHNETYTGTLKKTRTSLRRSNVYEYEFDNLIKLEIIRTSDQTVINRRIPINGSKIFRTGDYFELLPQEDGRKRKSRKIKSRPKN